MFLFKYKLELLLLSLAGLVFLSSHITLWIAFVLLSFVCLFVNVGLLVMLPKNLELQEEVRRELKEGKRSILYKSIWIIELFLIGALAATSISNTISIISILVITTELLKVYKIASYKEKASV